MVSLADKIYNAEAIVADLHGIGSEVWSRFTADQTEVRWYYNALAVEFERLMPGPVPARLRRAVDEMGQDR